MIKMMKKFSITLLVAMFSLLIIGFGGAAKAEAAGECAETQLTYGASESAAFTNCRAYEADAARYAAIDASYAIEPNNVQRAFEADAARYSALAASYTNETNNAQRAFEANVARYTGLAALYGTTCLGIGSINLTDAELVVCRSDSAYQAVNPELMVSRRFMVANDSAAPPISVGTLTLHQRIYNDWVIEAEAVDVSMLGQPNVSHQPILVDRQLLYNLLEEQQAAVQPIDINDLHQRVYSDWVIEAEAVDVSIQGQPAQSNVAGQPVPVDIEILRNNNYHDIQAANHSDWPVHPGH